MMIDATFLAIGVPEVMLGSASKSGFASSASFVATPMLALVLPPAEALAVILPVYLLVDAYGLSAFRGDWDARETLRLSIAAVPGVLCGAWLLTRADPDVIRLLIGLVSVGFVVWHVSLGRGWTRLPERRFGPLAGGVAGAVSGFTSYISHAGGPILTVYLLGRGLGKTSFHATTVVVFGAVNVMKAMGYGATGIFTRESLVAALWLAPAAVLGAWLGVRAHRAIPEVWFFRLTYVLLTAAGLKLIRDAVV